MGSVGLAVAKSGNVIGWKKWQIAFAIGTPIAIGLGCWIYYNKRRKIVLKKELKEEKIVSITKKTEDKTSNSKSNKLDANSVVETYADVAENAKITGNRFFKEGDYNQAVECYTKAIKLCPKNKNDSLATFYQNRAASYEKLKQFEKVVADCNLALELKPSYVKALNRRAKAFEKLDKLEEALEDATAICVLEEFQNQSSLILADRILKRLGQQRAKEAVKHCTPRPSSSHFIKTYFSSFAEDPIQTFTTDVEPSERVGFLKAQHDFINDQYDNIIEDCSVDADDETKPYQSLALLLRASFHILRGQPILASQDLKKLIELPNLDSKTKINALIKLASVEVQHENIESVFSYFQKAEETDSNNMDIYHHRGQVNLLLEKLEIACEDFKKATELNPDFAIAAVQKCYADYRLAHSKNNGSQIEDALDEFKKTVRKFSNSAEGFALYAQALVDQQSFEKADKYYDKALKLEPHNANIYVHKGLLQLNWKQDFNEAVRLIEKSIEVDDKCEFAYETLGALEVQKGNLDRALELFDKALESARTEAELSHLYSLRDAADAQKRVAARLGIALPQFS
ncbi:Mitochondrial import receptor subunit TOM70 [Chamberlinius hualienensis]